MARTKAFDETEVLDKAVDLFWTKGYNATSANDLVQALGLSRSSIYDTFKDKRSLFIRSLEHYRQRNVSQLITIIKESENIVETFEQIFKLILKQDLNKMIPKGCLIVNTTCEMSPQDQEINMIIKRNQLYLIKTFEAALKKGQSLGQIPDHLNAKSLASFMFNNISGLRIAMKSGLSKRHVDDVIKTCLTVLGS